MLRTFELIKKELVGNRVTIVAFKEELKVFEASGSGVKPLMDLLGRDEGVTEFYGLSWGDKVVGRAAALLLVNLKPRAVFGILMSETAIEVFKKFNIPFGYEEKVPYILNMKNDDMCPLEKKVKDIEDPQVCYETLKLFLKK
jgi:hypothetical protein